MKYYLLIPILFFYFTLSYSQEMETKKVDVYSNLFSGKLLYNTKLSEKWSLQNELKISNAFNFKSLEFTPLSIKYNITKKGSVLTESKLRYSFSNDDFYLGTQSNFSMLTQVGIRYDFTRDFFGEIIYEYNLLSNKNYNQTLEASRGRLRFGVGLKF